MTKEQLETELIKAIEVQNRAAAALLSIGQLLNDLAKSLNDSAAKSVKAVKDSRQ